MKLRRIFFLVIVYCILLTSCTGSNEGQVTASDTPCPYKLPWSPGTGSIRVGQSISDPTNLSHKPNAPEEFAIDFSLPEGTEVLATRGGVLSQVQNGQTLYGDRKFARYANYVIIDHEDGTFAYYTHLLSTSFTKADVEVTRVAQGQVIGLSGKTGWTEGAPHLHFQVQERGDRFSQSIPFCFLDVEGGIPLLHERYVSENERVAFTQGPIVASAEDSPPSISGEAEVGIVGIGSLDSTDYLSVVKWLNYAITNKEFSLVANLIGSGGTHYNAGYAQGIDWLGYNNSGEIVDKLSQMSGSPTCIGYEYDGYKVFVAFKGMSLVDVNQTTDITSFMFIPNNGNLELIGIIAIPDWGLDTVGLGSYLPCL